VCGVCVCMHVCLILCDLQTLTMKWPGPESGCCATETNNWQFRQAEMITALRPDVVAFFVSINI
jgi:hypothetical protein